MEERESDGKGKNKIKEVRHEHKKNNFICHPEQKILMWDNKQACQMTRRVKMKPGINTST
jgi:hypothetical protein